MFFVLVSNVQCVALLLFSRRFLCVCCVVGGLPVWIGMSSCVQWIGIVERVAHSARLG